jgi:hypothetical protein
MILQRIVVFTSIVSLVCFGLCFRAAGTELKPSTAKAFEEYVERTEARIQSEVSDPSRFLEIDALPDEQRAAEVSRLRNGEVVIQPMTMKGHETPVRVPGGLIHHWWAIAFIPGVTAGQVLHLEQDYARYGELYKPDVQSAKMLGVEGEHFQVYYRFYRHAIVTVVYNTEFEVDYFIPDNSRNYSLARSTRIAEVQNPQKPGPRLYVAAQPVFALCGARWRRVPTG